jgi:hypothetical protein
MKNLLLLSALLASVSIQAQTIERSSADPFGGPTTNSSSEHVIGQTASGYELKARLIQFDYKIGQDEYYLVINTDYTYSGCCGCANCGVKMLHEDGSIFEYEDIGDIECGDDCSTFIVLSKPKFPIKTIRLTRSKSYVDFDVSPEQWATIQKMWQLYE